MAEDHLDRLVSQHALAGAYQVNGQVKESVNLPENIQEQFRVDGHPHQLAEAHQATGQMAEAIALLVKLTYEVMAPRPRTGKILKQLRAEEYSDHLMLRSTLAGVYRVLGQMKKVVALLGKVVKIEEESLTGHHPDGSVLWGIIVEIHQSTEQMKEVEALLAEELMIYEQTLVEACPD